MPYCCRPRGTCSGLCGAKGGGGVEPPDSPLRKGLKRRPDLRFRLRRWILYSVQPLCPLSSNTLCTQHVSLGLLWQDLLFVVGGCAVVLCVGMGFFGACSRCGPSAAQCSRRPSVCRPTAACYRPNVVSEAPTHCPVTTNRSSSTSQAFRVLRAMKHKGNGG